jgi:hypothetical protein
MDRLWRSHRCRLDRRYRLHLAALSAPALFIELVGATFDLIVVRIVVPSRVMNK